MADLVRLVERALVARPGSSARDILSALQRESPLVTKTDVNSLLYSDRACYWNDGGTPPLWRLVGGVAPSPKMSPSKVPPPKPSVTPARPASVALPQLYAWQREALAAWRQQNRRAVVEAVTGTGKTLVGLAAAKEALDDGGSVLIVVPTVELQRQWVAQINMLMPDVPVGQLGDGHRDAFGLYRVIVAVVNSARDLDPGRPKPASLLLADECHRYGSASNARALDVRYSHRLGLSATYARSDDGNEAFLDPYFGGTCFRMDYRRALADGVTARFRVALVGVRFSVGERGRYEEADTKASDARRWLVANGWAPAEPFGEFMNTVTHLSKGDAGRATWRARSYLKNFAERRRILAESPAKTARLTDLVPALRGADRSILFTQTVEASEEAARRVGVSGLAAAAIHSGLDPVSRREVLGSFASGDLHVISAPQVLDEGIDVPAADLAVILAASRTRRQMIQRMGRVLRRKPDGRLARFAILYIERTSEDPAQGAHGDFLNEVTEVADDVRSFPSNAGATEICGFLMDMKPGQAGLTAPVSPTSAPADTASVKRVIVVSSRRSSSASGRSPIAAPPARPQPTSGGTGATKPPKAERDRREAAAVGISVDQLLERRCAEHQANLDLSEEAKRLGVTVKQLRKRLTSS